MTAEPAGKKVPIAGATHGIGLTMALALAGRGG